MNTKLQANDALLIVDPQNDFMPGGSLAVPNGDQIVPVLNQWINCAEKANIPIIISRDWHPPHHISFKELGGIWPPHCIQNTKGAEFHPDLKVPANAIIIDKAYHADLEVYSAFQGTTSDGKPLSKLLNELNVKRVWIGGLALDYCVHYSAVGAHENGFKFHVILLACRAIAENTEKKALEDLARLGAVFEKEANPLSI